MDYYKLIKKDGIFDADVESKASKISFRCTLKFGTKLKMKPKAFSWKTISNFHV